MTNSPISKLIAETLALAKEAYEEGTWEALEVTPREEKLAEMLQVACEAIKFYGSGRHLWAESEAAPKGVNVCPPIGHHACEALAQIDAIAAGESK